MVEMATKSRNLMLANKSVVCCQSPGILEIKWHQGLDDACRLVRHGRRGYARSRHALSGSQARLARQTRWWHVRGIFTLFRYPPGWVDEITLKNEDILNLRSSIFAGLFDTLGLAWRAIQFSAHPPVSASSRRTVPVRRLTGLDGSLGNLKTVSTPQT